MHVVSGWYTFPSVEKYVTNTEGERLFKYSFGKVLTKHGPNLYKSLNAKFI